MEKKKFDVEFHGTNLFALVPLLLFVVFCILFFVVFKTFDMMHLCMGGYVALIIGSLLSKNWGKYWDAVATGMSSKIMNELALILLIVGMFGKLMTRGGVAQGFVWLGDKIGLSGGGFVAFTFIATCVIATATGTSIGTMFTAFPILYPSGLLLGADPVFLAGAILSGAIFGDNVGPISDTTIGLRLHPGVHQQARRGRRGRRCGQPYEVRPGGRCRRHRLFRPVRRLRLRHQRG